MVLVKLGGVEMPAPTKYNVKRSDMDASGSGRTETGVMKRNRVRAKVPKLELGWTNLTTAEMQTVLAQTAPDAIRVEYYFGGQLLTEQMYAGDESLTLKALLDDDSARWDVSFNLITF